MCRYQWQVGVAWVGGTPRASLWQGSAESWVNLNPAGASSSLANGIHADQQVGWASIAGTQRAGLWSGSAASWVDLHPAGATTSTAWGVHDGRQVGSAIFGGIARAGLWEGSAASWVDLSQFLTGSWGSTTAFAIWSDETGTFVVGRGFNKDTGREEALMWHMTVPAPGAPALLGLAGLFSARRRRD
jgi:MYXO-CTERM domain-containing protein